MPVENDSPAAQTRQIGVSRPALPVTDLPQPEEVFKVKRIGLEELCLYVLGPALITLGLAIGSGEWLLGPLVVGGHGFRGIGWVIVLSIALQTFYNIELARFTIATGETPILAFGRTPPGFFLWIPLALFTFYMAFMLGGWAVSAGGSLFALFEGRPHRPDEITAVRMLGTILLASTFLFVSFGRNIERVLEISMGTLVMFIISGLLLVTIAVVPLGYFGEAIESLIIPSAPPVGTDPSLLGALAGFAGMASGLNFITIGYYRDKGYGMGYKTGHISGLIGGSRTDIMPAGMIFSENEKNTACWKRWFRFLLIDQWGIFFMGSIIGMMGPCILVGYLAGLPGVEHPTRATILTYAAVHLGQRYGPLLFGWALLMGFFILYTTQILTVETLTRNMTDAVYCTSAGLRRLVKFDPRRFYYPWMFFLVLAISIIIHIALPVDLILASANMSNVASMIFPLIMIYLNCKLPRPARMGWLPGLALIGNAVFYGFFFINFLVTHLTGMPLVRF